MEEFHIPSFPRRREPRSLAIGIPACAGMTNCARRISPSRRNDGLFRPPTYHQPELCRLGAGPNLSSLSPPHKRGLVVEFLNHSQELVENVLVVPGAGRCLRMVLNGKQGHIPVAGSFDSTVVEIDMGHFQPDGQGVRVHGKAVILGGDIDPPGLPSPAPDGCRPGGRRAACTCCRPERGLPVGGPGKCP